MADVPVGQRAARLPWLAPAGPSLLALTDAVPDISVLGRDPAAVALAVRYNRPSPTASTIRLDHRLFAPSLVSEAAARLVELGSWQSSESHVVASITDYTNTLRDVTDRPAVAVVALLAPLGWLAVASIDADAADDCLTAISDGEPPDAAQLRLWGMTHDAIARRLVRRWRFPDWLATGIGHLGLPDEIGPGDAIRSAVRAAIRSTGDPLGLIGSPSATLAQPSRGVRFDEPLQPHLLVRLLRTVARERRAVGIDEAERSAREFDSLAVAARAMAATTPDRLREAKLAAIAELAAGAGHEINNPLAVISGNAQLLLSHEEDEEQRATLNVIVRNSRRIADIVAELMQFARPRPPVRRSFGVGDWLNTALEPFRATAAVKGVRLDVERPADETCYADPDQLAKAVGELVRNAVEVTPSGGTVAVRFDAGSIIVEDDGPGPDPDMVEHLFDPFYSGRSAGRGRGLGLSVAWRLATQNGGHVRYEPVPGGPTRFVLQLPAEKPILSAADRKSA